MKKKLYTIDNKEQLNKILKQINQEPDLLLIKNLLLYIKINNQTVPIYFPFTLETKRFLLCLINPLLEDSVESLKEKKLECHEVSFFKKKRNYKRFVVVHDLEALDKELTDSLVFNFQKEKLVRKCNLIEDENAKIIFEDITFNFKRAIDLIDRIIILDKSLALEDINNLLIIKGFAFAKKTLTNDNQTRKLKI